MEGIYQTKGNIVDVMESVLENVIKVKTKNANASAPLSTRRKLTLHNRYMKTLTKWKTIEIDTKELKFDKNINISNWTEDLLKKVVYPKKKQKIELIVLTPKDLGFTEIPTTTQLFNEKNLKKYGVELCPASVGVFLRNEYLDQPKGEWLLIAMNPISGSDGGPRVFGVGCYFGGALWLSAHWADPGGVWSLGSRFVFRLRNVSQSSDTESLESSSEPSSSSLSAETSVEALEQQVEHLEGKLAKIKELL